MTGARHASRRHAAAILGATVLLTGCASSRRHPGEMGPGPGSFGVYRGALHEHDGSASRFRILLFAELPDRIHAELVSPVGTPRLILDGGGGNLAIALVEQRVAYVGDAEADSVRRAIGAPVSLSSLVRSLVLGEGPVDPEVETLREPRGRPGLPEMFEIRWGGRTLRIELLKLQPIRGRGPTLGSGTPPDGFSVHAMAEIGEEEGPLLLGPAP